MEEKILEVQDLSTSFKTERGWLKAIDGVSFDVYSGEMLGIVGESGCGKSVTSQSILRLYEEKNTTKYSGTVSFDGQNLFDLPEKEMQKIRGQEISMVFQDALSSLNPVFTVGNQIMESLRIHQDMGKKEAKEKAIDLLDQVGIPDPQRRFYQYPFELSGGMRQRVMIAVALACGPRILIADEPTTALDVTIQAQIMQLMGRIREETGTAIILITHDLGVVANLADRVAVMYAGKVVEQGTVQDIFYRPKHPYTSALLRSLPTVETSRDENLVSIPGTPPDLFAPPKGCAFASRCEHCMKICKNNQPPVFDIAEGHTAACWRLHPDFPGGKEENA